MIGRLIIGALAMGLIGCAGQDNCSEKRFDEGKASEELSKVCIHKNGTTSVTKSYPDGTSTRVEVNLDGDATFTVTNAEGQEIRTKEDYIEPHNDGFTHPSLPQSMQ